MRHINSLALLLSAIIVIICFSNAAEARPGPVDTNEKTATSGSIPPEAGDTSGLTDSQAMELYSQWLLSTDKARSATSTDNQAFSEGFTNFKQTLARVDQINNDPNMQWKAGINSRANLPASKHYPLMSVPFKAPPQPNDTSASGRGAVSYTGPKTVDWWKDGKVTPIKTQGQCGSCWAFSTLASIESKLMISGGPETDLSEQFLINCATESSGCRGGYLGKTLNFIQHGGGVPLESDDPYQEKETTCTSEPSRVQVDGWSSTKTYSASALMAAVAKQPVAFVFDVASDFELYKSGVYSSTLCLRTGVGPTSGHAMVIVGFNAVADPPYWIVRNSWGAGDSWGMDGYAYIKMDPDGSPGQCSMYMYPSYYPISVQIISESNGSDVSSQQMQQTQQVGDANDEQIPPPPPQPSPSPPVVPTPNDVTCVGQKYDNYYISRGKALKTLVVKSFDACANAAVANKGGSFNFSKKTKKCTVMKGSWSSVSQYLMPNNLMMAGYPNCTSSTKST